MFLPRECLGTRAVDRLLSWQWVEHSHSSTSVNALSMKEQKKCWAGRLKPQKSRLSQHFPPHTRQISRSNSSKTTQNSIERDPRGVQSSDQQADKFWCHWGELRQLLTKWNCSSSRMCLLGKAPVQSPVFYHHPHPKNPAGHCHTNRCSSRITHSQPCSQGISESWQIDVFCIF